MNIGITRWNETPFGVVRDFEREIGKIFDGSWNLRSEASFVPAVDVEETEQHYIMSFDLPGIKKEDINIEVHENQITISGERKQAYKRNTGSTSYKERAYGKFVRTFAIPQSVDTEKVEAHYENGVLVLALPKAEMAKSRKVQIQEGKGTLLQRLLGGKKEEAEKVA